jgi:transcriptional regulator with XRE-family HTH domain
MAKSYGSEQFRKLPVTAAKKCLALGVTLGTISKWENGLMAPRGEMRDRIAQEWPENAPAPELWDELLDGPSVAPGASEPRVVPAPELEAATPASVTREADEWLREVKRLRQELSSMGDAAERARLMGSAASILATLGKLTGVNLSVSERQIMASPHWQAIMSVVTLSLEPWPEAARAVQAALESTYTVRVSEAARSSGTE